MKTTLKAWNVILWLIKNVSLDSRQRPRKSPCRFTSDPNTFCINNAYHVTETWKFVRNYIYTAVQSKKTVKSLFWQKWDIYSLNLNQWKSTDYQWNLTDSNS